MCNWKSIILKQMALPIRHHNSPNRSRTVSCSLISGNGRCNSLSNWGLFWWRFIQFTTVASLSCPLQLRAQWGRALRAAEPNLAVLPPRTDKTESAGRSADTPPLAPAAPAPPRSSAAVTRCQAASSSLREDNLNENKVLCELRRHDFVARHCQDQFKGLGAFRFEKVWPNWEGLGHCQFFYFQR